MIDEKPRCIEDKGSGGKLEGTDWGVGAIGGVTIGETWVGDGVDEVEDEDEEDEASGDTKVDGGSVEEGWSTEGQNGDGSIGYLKEIISIHNKTGRPKKTF